MDDLVKIMESWNNFLESVNVAYAGSEGFGKQVIMPVNTATSKKRVILNNTVPPNSIGGTALRVTDNWNDGKELNDLHNMRLELDQMEREFMGADVMKDDKKRDSLKKQLEDLKKRIKMTTEKLTPVPTKDLA